MRPAETPKVYQNHRPPSPRPRIQRQPAERAPWDRQASPWPLGLSSRSQVSLGNALVSEAPLRDCSGGMNGPKHMRKCKAQLCPQAHSQVKLGNEGKEARLEPNTIHFRIFRPVHGGRARDRVLGAQGNVLRTRFTQRMLRRPVLGLTLSRAMSRRMRS